MGNFINNHVKPLLKHKVFSLCLLLVAMVVLFSVWSVLVGNRFFQTSTLKNIMNSLVVTSFLAIGAGCLLISGGIDLSQASIGAFGSMVLAISIKQLGLPAPIGIILGLAICAAFGALNGVLINVFRFPAFIATLAMSSMVKGLMYFASSGGNGGGTGGTASNVSFSNDFTRMLGKAEIGGIIPVGVLIMVVFFIVYGILMSKTKFGLKTTLVGGNPEASRLAGINPKTVSYLLYINSAVLGGVAGMFNASRIGQGSLLALQTNQFTGLTAAILGGISFGGGAGGLGGAFVGLLILNTFQIGMTTVKVDSFWVNVFSGVLLLVALSVDFITRNRKNRLKALTAVAEPKVIEAAEEEEAS